MISDMLHNFTTRGKRKVRAIFVVFCALSIGCSTVILKQFSDQEINEEISDDVAKKFEVKDVEIKQDTKEIEKKELAKNMSASKKSTTGKTPNKETVNSAPPVRVKSPMPFNVGEELLYDIRALGLTAGTFHLKVNPLKEIAGRAFYPITGYAQTISLFELIYRVNDRVESYMDAQGLFSHKYTMDIDESKQTKKVVEFYDYDKKKSYYYSKEHHVEKGISEKKEEHDIELWSQDPVSMLYWLRMIDIPKAAGQQVKYPVNVDGKPWIATLTFDRKEKKYFGGKWLDTIVVRMENTHKGEIKNKDHQIWFTDHPRQLVLRIEAKLKVGSVAAALDKVIPPL